MSGTPRILTSFDSVVLAAVADDLGPLVGGRIVRVLQPAPDEIVLDLRQRGSTAALLISIHARWARVHLTSLHASGDLSPFAQMLRRRLARAVLRSIQQPAFDRILMIDFETETGPGQLVVETMGRHSNLILVEDGQIAGSLKMVPRSKSSVREVLPGKPFLPAPRDRPTPLDLTLDSFAAMLQGSGPLDRTLAGSVLGLSVPMAAELAVRAGLVPDRAPPADAAERLWPHLQELMQIVREHRFAPTIYLDRTRPVAFTPFPFVSFEHFTHHAAERMSGAVDAVMTSAGAAARLEETRAGLLVSIDAALGKLTRTASEIEQALVESAHAHELRSQGELLLAYASQIRSGAREASVTGYDGRPVTIPLDPARSPVDNAQRLFKRYAKLRDALTALSARREHLAADRQALEHARARALDAGTLDELEDLTQELLAAGFVRARGRPSKPARRAGPRSLSLAGGYTVLAGRTNQENERVTFDLAAPDDLWFHARGVAGSHVILKTGGKRPPERAVAQAAAIAAYFSAARESGTVAVDYTQRKYVRKPKGAKPGLVTYEREKTIFIKPELPVVRKHGSTGAR